MAGEMPGKAGGTGSGSAVEADIDLVVDTDSGEDIGSAVGTGFAAGIDSVVDIDFGRGIGTAQEPDSW